LYDEHGKDYLDFLTGAGASILGHAHPAIVDAIRRYDGGFYSHLDLFTILEKEFIESLLQILPFASRNDVRVHFCAPTGSDAVEAALKLARIATGRSGVWAFAGSYHGGTQGALSVTSNKRLRGLGLHGNHDVVFFPFPSPSVFAFTFSSEEKAVELSTFLLNTALSDDHSGIEKPAAIIIEPVQGEGGVHVAPKRFMLFLREFCDRHDIILICDEVQSGFGRTGNWFACQHYQIEPDIICISKGIGGGLPIALIAYRSKFNVWPSGAHIGTFRGPSASIACSIAIMRIARESMMLEQVNDVGSRLLYGLSHLQQKHSIIADIRGIGLFLGVELSLNQPDESARLGQLLIENRIIAETVGRNGKTLKLLPPLNLSAPDAQEFCTRLDRVLTQLVQPERIPDR
jgi:diaminobutyrate-2-oxoglutarate transaminase